jgi:energy-converting hydrogenase Eha subunit A
VAKRGKPVELSFKTDVLRLRLLISGGLLLAGALLWAMSGWSIASFDGVLGAVVSLYFGGKTIFNLSEIAFPRPVVAIGPDFIHDRRLGNQPIPWSAVQQIKQVASGKVGGGTVFLEVTDPGRYIGPSKGLLWLIYLVRGLSGSMSRSTGFLPMTPPVVLDLGSGSLIGHLKAHAPRRITIS